MKVITKDTMLHDNFAMILEMTDVELAYIQEHPDKFLGLDLEFMRKLMTSKGNNAHIVQITLCEDLPITFFAQELLSKYDSVSWFNREHKFQIRRAKCLSSHLPPQ